MPVARIRTSDSEVIEFLSRHLADSGYQLEFVRPEEAVQGEADLEIDASRMDLDSAMEAARNETGLVTILSGVLKAEPRRDVFEEAAQAPSKPDYAELSPYAQGAELEDEPSMLHKTVDALGLAVEAGINVVRVAGKSVAVLVGEWKGRRDAERATRRENHERKTTMLAENSARRKDEEQRRRTEEDLSVAIRREEQARERAIVDRRRAEQMAATGIERQRQEQQREGIRGEDERELSEEASRIEQPQERETEVTAVEQALAEESAVDDNTVPEPSSDKPLMERLRNPAAAPVEAEDVRQRPFAHDRRQAPKPTKGSRDRAFERAGIAAALVAAGIVSFWSLSSMRRPANPLDVDQLRNSAIVKQQRPFGPAIAAAPAARTAGPVPRTALSARKPVAKKAVPRARASKPSPTKTRTANKSNPDDGGDEVTVRHFAPPKQQQATVTVKNGVKIISEN